MTMFGRLSVSALFLFGGAAVAQQSAWGQCGGTGFSGDTTCASGYACVALSDYYSQCQPGSASTTAATTTSKAATGTATTTTSKATSTGGTGTATGPGTTLQDGWYWIRAVESPNFHYYLQTEPQYETGTAVLESYTTAGQFNVIDGQLVELISAAGATEEYLYANVATNATHDGKTLAMSFETTKNDYGTFLWSGDALQWETDDIDRPNLSAWLVCEDQQLFINLGNYLYQTPDGCADETIHYYNDKTANGKRRRKMRKH